MDINQQFNLGSCVTNEQLDYFNEFGFIHFKNFLSKVEVDEIIGRLQCLEQKWVHAQTTKVNGIPLKFGYDHKGDKIVQRFAFANRYDDYLNHFMHDSRFELLKKFLPHANARIAHEEKDGLVVNHYISTQQSEFTQMGWHTDEVRDLFTVGKINPMLNIGISLDDSFKEKGGLKVIPGSHRQSLLGVLFKKRYFRDHAPDKNEISIETSAGDLTVHSGRIWHRVAPSSVVGEASRRRVMYFPIVTGKYKKRSEESNTPLYHHLQFLLK
jgi:ectoine hydroxylase-related dioxygenase (phytanoyl-CoA dioxygenase family)